MTALLIIGSLFVAGASTAGLLAWKRRWRPTFITLYGIEHEGARVDMVAAEVVESAALSDYPANERVSMAKGLRVVWRTGTKLHSGHAGMYHPPEDTKGLKGTIEVARGTARSPLVITAYPHELKHALEYLTKGHTDHEHKGWDD